MYAFSLQGEGGDKIEYRVWNPFRSKLAAAILGGVDQIHMPPGSKVLYLGAASGTTVSHVADIVGPVSLISNYLIAKIEATTFILQIIIILVSISRFIREIIYRPKKFLSESLFKKGRCDDNFTHVYSITHLLKLFNLQ